MPNEKDIFGMIEDSVPKISGFTRVQSDMSEMSFELPSAGFVLEPFDSGAMEVEMSFLYCGNRTGEDALDYADESMMSGKPVYIAVQLPYADEVPPPLPCSVGKMTARSDGWVKWRGELVRYYVFESKEMGEQWLMVSAPQDTAGTPLQTFLDKALDHAAETLTE